MIHGLCDRFCIDAVGAVIKICESGAIDYG